MSDPVAPLALARRMVGLANLTDADRRLLTDEVLERWTGDLSLEDITPDLLIDLVTYEKRRRAALTTLRSNAELTDQEFRLLRYLQRREGATCTYVQIAHHLWGTAHEPITAAKLRVRHGYASPMVTTIQVLMHQIRRKLEVDPIRPQHFACIRGVGYRYYSLPPSLDDGESYAARDTESRRQRHIMQIELGILDDDHIASAPEDLSLGAGSLALGRETIEGTVLDREDR